MTVSIDIDIGGTFTDCYVVYQDQAVSNKAPTTHYNLSVGFIQAIKGAAEKLGMDYEELLEETEVIRYSTTTALNALIERKGPKLGLITTAGFEDTILIGKGSQWAHGMPLAEIKNIAAIQKPQPLISRDMIVGLRERVDCFGKVIVPLKKEDVLEKVQYLVDKGCQGFVVSLLWSFLNPDHEQLVRQVIEEEYPDYYLGRMPIILSSEVSPRLGEYPRTMTTILSTYLQGSMRDHLTVLGQELRDNGYRKPMLMVHSTGGMAKISRTMAVSTYNAGPVAGLFGGIHLARQYGLENVAVTDMGGTSFDIGLVVKGGMPFYQFNPTIDRWQVNMSIVETKSIGAGGGSIGWIKPDFGTLEVGPQSAGSMPGPACYDQGGTEPTVTDADLVLGYLNPDYYLGGRMRLNREKAIQAIKNKLADPLGIGVEEAALRLCRVVDGHMGNEIFKETALKGYDPREVAIFAFGGAGGTHCCGFGRYLEAQRIFTSHLGSVFCAYGSSTMDIVHVYEASKHLIMQEPQGGAYLNDYQAFNEVVEKLRHMGLRDLEAEGFGKREIIFALELEMKYGTQLHTTRFTSPRLWLNSEEDVKEVTAAFNRAYGEMYDPIGAFPEGGMEVETIILKAIVMSTPVQFPALPLEGRDAGQALKGYRPVYWDNESGFVQTAVYDRSLLRSGNVVKGPAIIEADDSTIVIPGDYVYLLDQYLCGIIERIK